MEVVGARLDSEACQGVNRAKVEDIRSSTTPREVLQVSLGDARLPRALYGTKIRRRINLTPCEIYTCHKSPPVGQILRWRCTHRYRNSISMHKIPPPPDPHRSPARVGGSGGLETVEGNARVRRACRVLKYIPWTVPLSGRHRSHQAKADRPAPWLTDLAYSGLLAGTSGSPGGLPAHSGCKPRQR